MYRHDWKREVNGYWSLWFVVGYGLSAAGKRTKRRKWAGWFSPSRVKELSDAAD